MSMTLYGSFPSPYVRRIRMFMESLDYQFQPVNIYDDQDRAWFSNISPLKKLPVLVDADVTVFDSHVIQDYLRQKLGFAQPTIAEQNLVTVIDAVTDSLIVLFMGKRSGLTPDSDRLLFKLQLERIPDSLAWLNQQAQQGAFSEWHYPSMALIALVQWAEFRQLYEFSSYADLSAALAHHQALKIVHDTQPHA